MKNLLGSAAVAFSLMASTSMAVSPTGSDFNDTGDILARSGQHTEIEYDIIHPALKTGARSAVSQRFGHLNINRRKKVE